MSSGPSCARRLAAIRGAALVAAVAAAALLLVASGHGALAPPPRWSPADLRSWAEQRGTVAAAMALLRLLALVLGALSVVAGACAAAGARAGVPWLVTVAQRISPPGTRPLVQRLAGLGLVAASVVGPASTAMAGPAPPSHVASDDVAGRGGAPGSVTLVLLPERPSTGFGDDASGAGTATMWRTDEPPPAPRPPTAAQAASPTSAASAARPPVPSSTLEAGRPPSRPRSPGPVHVVRRGEHLWSIAEGTLSANWGRHPTEPEVDRYWQAVVQANRELADPDVLYAGQEVNLPPVPPQPSTPAMRG